jgi:hypothetical protein
MQGLGGPSHHSSCMRGILVQLNFALILCVCCVCVFIASFRSRVFKETQTTSMYSIIAPSFSPLKSEGTPERYQVESLSYNTSTTEYRPYLPVYNQSHCCSSNHENASFLFRSPMMTHASSDLHRKRTDGRTKQ